MHLSTLHREMRRAHDRVRRADEARRRAEASAQVVRDWEAAVVAIHRLRAEVRIARRIAVVVEG